MLQVRRIEIENFVCFERLILEPSTDPEQPLTVVRAENGSGKTTLLRAIRWAMYSEKGLPGVSSRYSLHPVWWRPDEDGIKTRVSIEFETDGSTRHHAEGGGRTVYQLVRSVTTISQPTSSDDEPDFHRIGESEQLMVKDGDGMWGRYPGGTSVVIEELLPWGLRDFFVMDADEATDFVGGGENKPMSRQAVEEKTTAAVHSLLGIDVFRKALARVEAAEQAFGKAATDAIGDADLDKMQRDLDRSRQNHADLEETLLEERAQSGDIQDRLEQRRDDLETELKGIGAKGELEKRLAGNRDREKRLKKDRANTVSLLGSLIQDSDLYSVLCISDIRKAYEWLKPLYERGQIPVRHLTFVRDLLERGTCVCGEDLASDGRHRLHVEERIVESAAQEDRANYLGQLYETTKSLLAISIGEDDSWIKRRRELTGQLTDTEDELSVVGLDMREIAKKLDEVDDEKIQVLRDEIGALTTQADNFGRNITLHETELSSLASTISSLHKTILGRQRTERVAADKRAAENMALLVRDVLESAYERIQEEQVTELSDRMNRLFAQMAANVSDEDFDVGQGNKATLRMIAEVGLRPVEARPERFEIFALNNRRRAMPPIEINGASRRVLALSFVLALCRESRTEAPFIADSLLNFMSGAVRRNTLQVTANNASQPIFLLTGADLEGQSELEIVREMAGMTYTLTGQWDAIEAGSGGDVVYRTADKPIALLCRCGPREWCAVCERLGQANRPGWAKRE